jgi:hypothetical protein
VSEGTRDSVGGVDVMKACVPSVRAEVAKTFAGREGRGFLVLAAGVVE